MHRSTVRLVLWALSGAVVLCLTYLVMVRLGTGQWLDDLGFEGRKSTRLAARRLMTWGVGAFTPAVSAVVGGCAVWLAMRRRGWMAALSVAAAILGTPLVARAMKDLLPRTDLGRDTFLSPANSYPSGHSAVAMVVALMAVTVAPPLWRPRVTGIASVAVVVHTVGMAGSGWHRPSDLAGGIALAVAVAGIASLPVLHSWRDPREVVGDQWFTRTGSVLGAALLAAVAPLPWYVPIRLLGTSSYGSFKAHLVVTLATCAAAAAVVTLHARLVDAADAAVVASPSGVAGSGLGEQ